MKSGHPPIKIKRLLLLQSGLLVILSLLLWLLTNAYYAHSAFLGGVICVLPTWVFALILFRVSGARSAKDILKNFYWGEAVKLVISIFLFALVFSTMKVSAGALFSAFIIMQLTFWLGPLVLKI